MEKIIKSIQNQIDKNAKTMGKIRSEMDNGKYDNYEIYCRIDKEQDKLYHCKKMLTK